MKTTQKIRSVAVAVKLSDASWRDFLMGFFDYAKRGTHWDIRVVQSADELQRAVSGCLGVVTGIEPDRKTQALLAKAGTPLTSLFAAAGISLLSRRQPASESNQQSGMYFLKWGLSLTQLVNMNGWEKSVSPAESTEYAFSLRYTWSPSGRLNEHSCPSALCTMPFFEITSKRAGLSVEAKSFFPSNDMLVKFNAPRPMTAP